MFLCRKLTKILPNYHQRLPLSRVLTIKTFSELPLTIGGSGGRVLGRSIGTGIKYLCFTTLYTRLKKNLN